MSRRPLAALLAFVLASQTAAPALADGFDDLVCEAPPEAANGANPSYEFKILVRDYVRAYGGDSRLGRALYASRIKRAVFAHTGTQEYVEELRYIDSQAAAAPEAVYDLAKTLQLHWEARYAVGLGQRALDRQERRDTSTKIGALVGIAGLGAAMIFRPQNAPRYFLVLRHLMPAAGFAAGRAIGQGLNASGLLEDRLPVSPAHVMELGIQTDEFAYDDDSLHRLLFPAFAGVGASFAAYEAGVIAVNALRVVRAVRYANMAATPAKIHPLVLVGSLVVGFLVEKGVEDQIDRSEYARLTANVHAARAAIDAALRRGDDAMAYSQADALARHVANLAAYINRPISEAVKGYAAEVAEAAQEHGEGSPRFRRELDELTRDLSSQVREALTDRDLPPDTEYQGFLVRGFLRNHDEASIRSLGDLARYRADAYVAGFERWVTRTEQLDRVSLGPEARERLLKEYLDGVGAVKDRRLADELRAGRFRRDANRLFLQAAAFLRQTGREYLEDHADSLAAIAARTDLLVSTSAGRAMTGTLDFHR
jgi:hypothetical protein